MHKPTKQWNPPESCFDFDRKTAEGDKVLFLRNICFYFTVARFTYFSLLPEVDKRIDHVLTLFRPKPERVDVITAVVYQVLPLCVFGVPGE